MSKHKKTHDKKCSIKNHNLLDKNTILVVLISWWTFILVLCSNTFSLINHYQSHNVLSYLLPWTYYSHIIFILFQEITLIYIIYDPWNFKKEVKRELKYTCVIWNWLHHGCFHMLNEKGNFSFSPFALTFVPFLRVFWTMLRYLHLHMSMTCYVEITLI
jgi:hypothetical protein